MFLCIKITRGIITVRKMNFVERGALFEKTCFKMKTIVNINSMAVVEGS